MGLMEGVFAWVRNIAVFFLLSTLLEELLPTSDYKKYIRVCIGMVFILVVFSPLLKFFNMSDSLDYYFWQESLKTQMEGASLAEGRGFSPKAAEMEKEAWVLKSYKDQLSRQICLLLENEGYGVESLEFQVNEDMQADDFGQITRLSAVVTRLETDPLVRDASAKADEKNRETEIFVEAIHIDGAKSEIFVEETSEESFVLEDLSQRDLKELLSANYGVPKGEISLEIRGDGHA